MVTSKSFSLGILLFFMLTGLNAQTKKAQKVLAAEAFRFEAMTRADTASLRPMLAEELVYIHSNAMQENKSEHLAAIASRKLVYEKMDREKANVRFYGKTALVNGELVVSGILKGNPFELRLLYLAVYRKKRNVWILINWQSTKKV